MDEIKEAFEIVFGEEFLNEMATRLLIIACSLAAVWKSIACRKVKNAVFSLSEHPDDQHAELFVTEVGKISAVGKFFAGHSKSFSGLSKSDCRVIFNSTVLTAPKISNENKKSVRDCLMKIGCNGLTDINSI